MGFLDAVLSSPLPTIVVLVIAVALAAGYWFFLLPLVENLKSTQKANTEANEIISSFQENLKSISDALEQQSKQITTVVRSNRVLITQADKHLQQVSIVSQQCARLATRSKLLEEQEKTLQALERNVENCRRALSEINDKQSQLTGVVFGLNLRGTQPPRGP